MDLLAQAVAGRVIVIMEPGFNSPRRLNRITHIYDVYMCINIYVYVYVYI